MVDNVSYNKTSNYYYYLFTNFHRLVCAVWWKAIGIMIKEIVVLVVNNGWQWFI